MDDYLYYLNTIKSYGSQPANAQYDNRRNSSGSKYFKDYNRGSRDGDRRKPRREFKDYDNPSEASQQTSYSGRQLISYDDL